MVEHGIQAQIFELTGGRLCLDFANTMTDRVADSPQELLNSYSDLVSWSHQAHILTDEEVQRLLEEGERRSAEASGVLRRAIVFREAMYRIFRAAAEDSAPSEIDLAILNTALSEAMSHARIVPETGAFTWAWIDDEGSLERTLWPVVRSAADILTSNELKAVRVCASDDCNWLFLDTSKNHSRRWCDMKSCGNRAKARKHYSQKKRASYSIVEIVHDASDRSN